MMKTLAWLAYVLISLCIAPLNWLRNRIQHGPSARLWLATDEQIAAEFKRRGLARRKNTGPKVERPADTPPTITLDSTTMDAVRVVSALNGASQAKATDAVIRAAREMAKGGRRPGTQELTILALKMAS